MGICGSDVHYLRVICCSLTERMKDNVAYICLLFECVQEMRIAHFVVKEPMVIGHECAGVIEEVGSGVTHLAVGDRVALEPGISCWRCRHCKGGRYNLCEDMKFFATPPVHGSLANQASKQFSSISISLQEEDAILINVVVLRSCTLVICASSCRRT